MLAYALSMLTYADVCSVSSDAASRSQYARDLRAWFARFPRSQFLVLASEQVLSDVC